MRFELIQVYSLTVLTARLHGRSGFSMYERLMRESNAADFNELLMRTAALLEGRTEEAFRVRQRVRARFQYLLVDEYQVRQLTE